MAGVIIRAFHSDLSTPFSASFGFISQITPRLNRISIDFPRRLYTPSLLLLSIFKLRAFLLPSLSYCINSSSAVVVVNLRAADRGKFMIAVKSEPLTADESSERRVKERKKTASRTILKRLTSNPQEQQN